jgi:hypothetical protein
MNPLDFFKYKVLTDLNLVLAFPISKSGDLSGLMQTMNDTLISHPGYVEKMDVIIDYRQTEFPDFEVYYNDLDKLVSLSVRLGTLVDIMRPDKKHLEEYSKIFNVFAVNNKGFAEKVVYAYSVDESIAALGHQDHADIIKEFFSTPPKG